LRQIKSMLKPKRLASILLLAALAYLAVSACTIALYANYANERQADSIIVLGAATWGNQPSPVFRERINHAIELWQQGYAPIIIFTGGTDDDEEAAEAEVARQYAIKHGVPPDSILIETVSRTTEQNLYYAKQLIVEHDLADSLIVSDPLHMKRAMLMAEDMGLEAYSSPTPTTRYRSWRTQLVFLARETYFYQTYLLRRPFHRYTRKTMR